MGLDLLVASGQPNRAAGDAGEIGSRNLGAWGRAVLRGDKTHAGTEPEWRAVCGCAVVRLAARGAALTVVVTIVLVFAAFVIGLHLLVTCVAVVRVRPVLAPDGDEAGRAPAASPADLAVDVIVPVKGLDADGAETIASLLQFDHGNHQVIFALDDPDDPAIPVIRAASARFGRPVRIETGDNLVASNNPKIDTLSKAYAASRAPLLMHCDANVLMEPGRLKDSLRRLVAGVGMVTAAFVGVRARNGGALLEAAILNGYHARLLLAGNALGVPSAIGKLMLYRREDLEAAGGFVRLTENPADDTALEHVVVGQGLKVRMAPTPLRQPLGRRRFGEVWQRQIRWLVMRRINHRLAHAGEALVSFVPGAVAAAAGAPAAGISSGVALLVFAALWYGAEAVFLWRARVPTPFYAVAFWLLRDLLLLPMWVSSWGARTIEWRGQKLKP